MKVQARLAILYERRLFLVVFPVNRSPDGDGVHEGTVAAMILEIKLGVKDVGAENKITHEYKKVLLNKYFWFENNRFR